MCQCCSLTAYYYVFTAEVDNDESPKEDLELPIFDLATIVKATDDFSISNKLGEGGFGTIYMVIMQHSGLMNIRTYNSLIIFICCKCTYVWEIIRCPSRWTRNCCEEALIEFQTRVDRIHE